MKNYLIFGILMLMSIGMVSAFSGNGDGRSGDPYQITSCTQLQEMSDDLSAYYSLVNDIDCSDTINWNGGQGFVPISPFSGVFYGGNHSISNLYINISSGDQYYRVGLFGENNGVIKNVNIVNAEIHGLGMVGIVAGYNNNRIDNCHVTGNVSGNAPGDGGVGGIAGRQDTGGVFYSSADVTIPLSGWGNGGIIGRCYGGSIQFSHSSGYIASGGGIAGQINCGISNSYSTATSPDSGLVSNNGGGIENSYATGLAGAGLCGFSYGGESNSFWDIETSGTNYSVIGTGLTTAQMKTQSSFTNWDFVNVWTINEGVSYPQLLGPPQCTENWVSDNTNVCNGIDPSYKITYTDTNYCGTINSIPQDEGTVVNCCVENWQPNQCGPNDAAVYNYADENNCGTTYNLPLDYELIYCINQNLYNYTFNHTQADTGDCLADGVCLTRGTSNYLYNREDVAWNCGYCGAETSDWVGSFGMLYMSNSWNGCAGQLSQIAGKPLCMHIVHADTYWNVTFNSWTSGGAGGGFSYTRNNGLTEVNFTKTDYGTEQDCFDGVCLTRGNTNYLYNDKNVKWTCGECFSDVFGYYNDFGFLVMNNSWAACISNFGSNIVGVPLCAYLPNEDKYVNIIFDYWQGGGGGDFTYRRGGLLSKPVQQITSSTPGKTRYLVDASGNVVGVMQGQQLVQQSQGAPMLSIAGEGVGFDILAWLKDLWVTIQGWFM